MSPVAIGTDIVDKRRIAGLHERHGERFARRILTRAELDDLARTRDVGGFLARRFCAKEAVSKVLGTGLAQGITFHDIEIAHDALGRPLVRLHGKARHRARELGIGEIALSISDERAYAVAFAIGHAAS